MGKKILLATEKPFAKSAVTGISDIFKKAGYEMVALESYKAKEDLLDAVSDVDGMIIRSDIVDEAVLSAAKNLRIVVRAGAGYDNIDLKAASERNVVAMNTPGQNSNAVAELVFALMLNLARGAFSGKSGSELRGKKIGLQAYGAVGRCVTPIAKGFGMEVFAFDPFVPAEAIQKDGVTPVNSLEELYQACDYVSIHIPKTKETVNSINFALLSRMKKGAALINTARAEVIDEASLLKIFAERPDFKYGADVAPACAAEIAEKFAGRFVFTAKKMGAQTEEANVNAGLAAANQIVAFFEKGDKTFQVNK
ncbi:MAG: 3-phosphoglycerate dehydrogenase [Candidatus Aminicenantes bacterium]|nr:3-phosphoglycerate dehydrogenase [Acidobacteriota bacterium]MCG2812239.1 3-phosphoglycerate dehydrogenase [Candidatus Aminicenantes bacterium]